MPKLSTIHPFLFAIFPIILLYSQNIHLLPIEEIIIPILLVVGLSTISWIILNYFLRNMLKAGLIVSLFLVVFFSYGHVYNILDDVSFLGFDIGRHIFLLIPFFAALVLGIIFLLKTKRKLNNLLNELDSPDIVIVEGFKNEPHQKIEIIKEGSNNYLFTKLENIIGIVSDKKIDTLIPQFKREDIESIAEHILNNLKK